MFTHDERRMPTMNEVHGIMSASESGESLFIPDKQQKLTHSDRTPNIDMNKVLDIMTTK